MTLHMAASILGWAALLLGCAIGAHGLFILKTNRLPNWYHRYDQRPARPVAWSFLSMATFVVMTTLPQVMNWASWLVLAFTLLAVVPLAGYLVLAMKKRVRRQ
ncbi:hypothetical protein SAMN05216276_107716 [Streptosporangium subroseum]|uniref:SdpI/YhfL protein family protein n=1 Tax=Streptosporangium subroseum TaxID=106412 RepID=A0A239NZK2_9ACTN|nr:hypothetical protein SAMN05216276_107716 [Streptosporangium subroseum]